MPRLEPEPISPGLHRLNPLSLPPKLLIRPLQGLYPHTPPLVTRDFMLMVATTTLNSSRQALPAMLPKHLAT